MVDLTRAAASAAISAIARPGIRMQVPAIEGAVLRQIRDAFARASSDFKAAGPTWRSRHL